MELTIEQYCIKEKISRAGYHKRVRKGYISQDRLGRNDGNKITIKMPDDKKTKNSISNRYHLVPDDNQCVLITLENGTITGAEYRHSLTVDIQKRFSPVGIEINNKCDYKESCYSFPGFTHKITHWEALSE